MGQIAPEINVVQKGGILSGLRKSIAAAGKKVVRSIQTFKLPIGRKTPVAQPGAPVTQKATTTPTAKPSIFGSLFKSKKATDQLTRKQQLADTKQKAAEAKLEAARIAAQKRKGPLVAWNGAPPVQPTKSRVTTIKKASTDNKRILKEKRVQATKILKRIDAIAKRKAEAAKKTGMLKWLTMGRMKKNDAAVKAKIKLAAIANDRAGRRIESKQKDAKTAGTLSAKNHAQNLEGYMRSKDAADVSDPPKPTESGVFDKSITTETAVSAKLNTERNAAQSRVDDIEGGAPRVRDEITRAADDMRATRTTIGGTDGRGALLGDIGEVSSGIRTMEGDVSSKRNIAESSRALADKQSANAATARGKGEDTSAVNSAAATRESNMDAAEGYGAAATAAGARKTTAEGDVNSIQSQRQISVARGLGDANTEVSNTKRNLDAVGGAMNGPAGVKTKHGEGQDKVAQTETVLANSGVAAKQGDVVTTLRERTDAEATYKVDQDAVTTARTLFDNEKNVVEPPLRADRVKAEGQLAGMTPVRSALDTPLTTRRDAIPDELKAAETKLAAAVGPASRLTAARDVGPTSLKTMRENVIQELNALSADMRNNLTPRDVALKTRATTSAAGAVDPRTNSVSLGGELKQRRDALMDSLQNADEAMARINLARAKGIPTRPTDTPSELGQRLSTTSGRGRAAATAHGSALGAKNALNLEVGKRDGLIATDSAIVAGKKGEVADVDRNVAVETSVSGAVWNKRNAAADSGVDGKKGAERAETEIRAAAANMDTTRITIGGADGRGGLLGNIGEISSGIRTMDVRNMEEGIIDMRNRADSSKAHADKEGANAAAARARGEDMSAVNGADAARKGDMNNHDTNKANALDSAGKKAVAEADAVRIKAAADKEVADIAAAQAAVVKSRAEADAAKAAAAAAGADLKRIQDQEAAAAAAAEAARREAIRLEAEANAAIARADSANAAVKVATETAYTMLRKGDADAGKAYTDEASRRAAEDRIKAEKAAADADAAAKRAEAEHIAANERLNALERAVAQAEAIAEAKLAAQRAEAAKADAIAKAADAKRLSDEAEAAARRAADDGARAEAAKAAAKRAADAAEAEALLAEARALAAKADADAKIAAERARIAKQRADDAQAELDRIRKLLDDANMELRDTIRKIQQARRDLAGANANLLRIKEQGEQMMLRRREAEIDMDDIEAAIRKKTHQKDDEQQDIDDANTRHLRDEDELNTARRDYDDENTAEGRYRKDRDDAFNDAEAQRPRKDPADRWNEMRRKALDDDIPDAEARLRRTLDEEDGSLGDINTVNGKRNPYDNPDPNDQLRIKLEALRRRKQGEEEYKRVLEYRKRDLEEDINPNLMRRFMLIGMLVIVMNLIFRIIIVRPPPAVPTPPVVVWPPPASGPQAPSFSGPEGVSGAQQGQSGPTDGSMPSAAIPPGMAPLFNLPSGAFAVPSGPQVKTEYEKGITDGGFNGDNDGKKDGTEDGMKRGVGIDEDLEDIVLQELMKETSKIDSIVNENINKLEHNGYCAQIEKEGIRRKINVRSKFPECLDYFTLMNTPDFLEYGENITEYGEKDATYGEGNEYGETPDIEPADPSTAASNVSGEPDVSGKGAVSGEGEEAQEGGYREDADGVMQYAGAYTISIAEPQTPYDIGYAKAYKEAYQTAYNLAFTITKMALLTTETNKRLNTNSGVEYGELAGEYGSKDAEYGTADTKYGEEVSGEPVSGEPQEGGYLKKLQRAMRSKGINRGGARLLKRIVNKTTGQ